MFTKLGHKTLTVFLALSLIVPPNLYAQSSGQAGLPVPGTMLSLSKPYMPVMVKGLLVHPEHPFKFDFIIDSGDTGFKGAALKAESMKLIKYFLAALTVPEEEMWVNLSPYEKGRMIPKTFGDTDMGRDLLAQDYILKQLTASLTYPEKEMGKTFWDKVYEQAQAKFGTTNIPVNTFNKVWIVPQKAGVYEHANGAFVIESKLKVMTEQDYLAMRKHVDIQDPNINALGAQIIRQIIIPALEKEVNEGSHFANLRQIYQAMILATWYKIRLKDSILGKLYVDQKKVKGLKYHSSLSFPNTNRLSFPNASVGNPGMDDIEAIYQQYLRAFKKGVYNYIKEDLDPATKNIVPRKYVSGGFTVEAGVTGAGNNFSLMVGRGTTSNPAFAMLSKVEEFEGDSAQVTWEANRIASKSMADAAMARGRETIDQKFLNYWKLPKIQKEMLETMDPGIIRNLRILFNQMLTPLREVVKKDDQNVNTKHQIDIREKALKLLDKKELDELEKRIAPILVQSYKPGSSTVDSLINALKQIDLGDNVVTSEMIINRKDVSTLFSKFSADELDNQGKSTPVQDIDNLRKTLTKNTAWKVLRFTIGSSSIDVVVGLPHLYLVRIQPPSPEMVSQTPSPAMTAFEPPILTVSQKQAEDVLLEVLHRPAPTRIEKFAQIFAAAALLSKPRIFSSWNEKEYESIHDVSMPEKGRWVDDIRKKIGLRTKAEKHALEVLIPLVRDHDNGIGYLAAVALKTYVPDNPSPFLTSFILDEKSHDDNYLNRLFPDVQLFYNIRDIKNIRNIIRAGEIAGALSYVYNDVLSPYANKKFAASVLVWSLMHADSVQGTEINSELYKKTGEFFENELEHAQGLKRAIVYALVYNRDMFVDLANRYNPRLRTPNTTEAKPNPAMTVPVQELKMGQSIETYSLSTGYPLKKIRISLDYVGKISLSNDKFLRHSIPAPRNIEQILVYGPIVIIKSKFGKIWRVGFYSLMSNLSLKSLRYADIVRNVQWKSPSSFEYEGILYFKRQLSINGVFKPSKDAYQLDVSFGGEPYTIHALLNIISEGHEITINLSTLLLNLLPEVTSQPSAAMVVPVTMDALVKKIEGEWNMVWPYNARRRDGSYTLINKPFKIFVKITKSSDYYSLNFKSSFEGILGASRTVPINASVEDLFQQFNSVMMDQWQSYFATDSVERQSTIARSVYETMKLQKSNQAKQDYFSGKPTTSPAMIGRHSGSIGGQTSVTTEDINELFRAASEENSVDAMLQLYKIISTGILGSVRVNKDMRDDVWLRWQSQPELLRRLLDSSPASAAMLAIKDFMDKDASGRETVWSQLGDREKTILYNDVFGEYLYLQKKVRESYIPNQKEVEQLDKLIGALKSIRSFNHAMTVAQAEKEVDLHAADKNRKALINLRDGFLSKEAARLQENYPNSAEYQRAIDLIDRINRIVNGLSRVTKANLHRPLTVVSSHVPTGQAFQAVTGQVDQALIAKGGIDLNTKKGLDFEIKRDDKGMPLPVQLQDLQELDFETLYPEILSIGGVPNFSELLGLDQKPPQKQAAV